MSVTIGLVGAGHRAAQVHAPTLAGTSGIGFAGVWSRSPEPVREIAERYGVPRFDRFAELLDRCDAVAFAVPPPVQAELAADAARRGKAIFLERPLAADIAGAEELAAAVQAHHVISQRGLAWRYAPAVRRFLSDEVKRVEIFGPGGAAVVDCTAASGPEAYRTMYADFAEAIQQDRAPNLDVQHGLHLQRVIESAETEALRGT